jgi:hypothetical protein
MSKPKVLSPEEEAQKEDEQTLSRIEQDVEEILKLIEDRTNRAEAERRLSEAQASVDEKRQGTIFHQHSKGNRKIPLKHHTSNLFRLTEALELHMRTLRHGEDLHRSLDNHLRHKVKVLQRVKKRGLFK